MSETSRIRYEAAGIAVLVVTGIIAAIATPLLAGILPWVSASLVFLVLVGIAWLWLRMSDAPHTGAGVTAESTDGGVLDVDLVDWANERVGTECLRCETDIEYVPLGAEEGRTEHRIECGCTMIHSAPKD